MGTDTPRIAFLKKAIKARQLAVELRNLLEELDTDDREQEFYQYNTAFDEMSAEVELIEQQLDRDFSPETYPSSDPLTWKEA